MALILVEGKNNPQQGVVYLEKAFSLDDKNLELCESIASLYKQLGDRNKLIAWYKKIMALNPADEFVFELLVQLLGEEIVTKQQVESVGLVWEDVLAKSRKNNWVKNEFEGQVFLERNFYSRKERISEAFGADAQKVLSILKESHEQAKQETLAYCNDFISKNSDEFVQFKALSGLLCYMDSRQERRELQARLNLIEIRRLEQESLTETDPEMVILNLKILAGDYRKSGDYKKACECYEKLVELNGDNQSYLEFRNIAYCYKALGDKKNEKLYHERADAVSTPDYKAKHGIPSDNKGSSERKKAASKDDEFLIRIDLDGNITNT